MFDINCGGCCYIAYCVARLLERDNIPFLTVVYNCNYDEFYDIDCSCYHYAILVGERIINGFDEDDYTTFANVTSKDLLDHYKECDWNCVYNTWYNTFLFHIINMFYYVFTKNLREG